MATAKPRNGPRRHRTRNALVLVVLAMAVVVAVFRRGLQAQALLATSYAAHIGCTCHYVAGRSLADCRKDFEPGMALVTLSDRPETHTVIARIPLIATQTATFRDGAGCQLQNWVP